MKSGGAHVSTSINEKASLSYYSYTMILNFTLFYGQFVASFECCGEQNCGKMMGPGMSNTLLNNSYFGQRSPISRSIMDSLSLV